MVPCRSVIQDHSDHDSLMNRWIHSGHRFICSHLSPAFFFSCKFLFVERGNPDQRARKRMQSARRRAKTKDISQATPHCVFSACVLWSRRTQAKTDCLWTGYMGSCDVPWSKLFWITDPDPDHWKLAHPKQQNLLGTYFECCELKLSVEYQGYVVGYVGGEDGESGEVGWGWGGVGGGLSCLGGTTETNWARSCGRICLFNSAEWIPLIKR